MPEEKPNPASTSFDVNATSVFYKKDGAIAGGMSGSNEAPSLFCKYLLNGAWAQKTFPTGKSNIKIGTGNSDCDLVAPQAPGIARIHLALRLVLHNWFVLEHAPERAMSINGVRRPQAILRKGDACIVTLGEMQIALKSVAKGASQEAQAFDPLKPVVYFRTKDREYKLGIDSCGLIGSDVECRIQEPKLDPVAGIVFAHHGKPYLFATKSNAPLSVNGKDATAAPQELTSGSVVMQGKDGVFNVEIKPLPEEPSGALPPGDFKGNLALLDISENRFGAKLILPPAGRSLMIGRDSSNHFMLESLNVSKKHAQLIIYDNSVLVLDAHSTNGTFVEEEPISKKLLHPGEIVRFADRRFLLCHSE